MSYKQVNKWSRSEKIFIPFIFLLSFILRLPKITNPKCTVYDEMILGSIISSYISHEFFFSSNPIFPGLFYTFILKILGCKNFIFNDEVIDDIISNGFEFIQLRYFSTLFSAIIPVIIYISLVNFGVPVYSSALIGCFLSIENSLITVSGYVINEIIQCFLVSFSILISSLLINSNIKILFLSLIGGILLLANELNVFLVTYLILKQALADFDWPIRPIKKKKIHTISKLIISILMIGLIYIAGYYVHFKTIKKISWDINLDSGENLYKLANSYVKEIDNTKISIKNNETFFLKSFTDSRFLISLLIKYPDQYTDGRLSSKRMGIGVSKYNEDINISIFQWKFIKLKYDHDKSWNLNLSDDAIIKKGDLIAIKNIKTGMYISCNDISSPLTLTGMELSLKNDLDLSSVWIIEPILSELTYYGLPYRLFHKDSKALLLNESEELPKWSKLGLQKLTKKDLSSLKILEVNGAKENLSYDTFWISQKSIYNIKPPIYSISFFERFKLFHKIKISNNEESDSLNFLVSSPISWPFMYNGMLIWESEDSKSKIYLLGNFFIWILALISIIIFPFIILKNYLQLKLEIISESDNTDLIKLGLNFYLIWALLYLPYFYYKSSGFLIWYLSSNIIAICLSSIIITLLLPKEKKNCYSLCILMFSIAFFFFLKYKCLIYGFNASPDYLKKLKIFKSWDFI